MTASQTVDVDAPIYTVDSLLKQLQPDDAAPVTVHYLVAKETDNDDTTASVTKAIITRMQKLSGVGAENWQGWSSSAQMLTQARLDAAAIIIYQLALADMEVEALLDDLAKRHSPAAVIVVGEGLSGTRVAYLLKRGVVDYLSSSFANDIEASNVRALLMQARQVSVERAKLRGLYMLYQQLTDKERHVAHQLMQGHINKVIADNLDISVRTVEVRRAQIMKKLQCVNSVDLVQKLLLVNLWQSYAYF